MDVVKMVKDASELNRHGRNVFDEPSAGGLQKVRQGLQAMLDRAPRDRDGQIEYAYQLYLQEFADIPQEEEFISARAMFSHYSSKANLVFNRDLGVKTESNMDTSQLMLSLGLGGRTVFPFMNNAMNVQSWPAWTKKLPSSEIHARLQAASKADKEGTTIDASWTSARLRPHQIAGVHAILSRMVQTASRGVLIADEVGVGKTCQAAAVLAMMLHATEQSGHSLACGKLPALQGPTVIISPNSLTHNWACELNVWMSGIEVFHYDLPEAARPDYFSDQSTWSRSKTPLHRRVLLLSETTLARDASLAFSSGTGQTPQRKTGHDNRHDLLGHFHGPSSIGLLIIDEAHNYRSRRRNYDGAMYLGKCAVGVIALTATPVFTHPSVCILPLDRHCPCLSCEQDLLAIGEMLRLPDCRQGTRSQRDLPKDMDKTRTEAAIRDIRKSFGDTIIRRDLFSKGPDGKRISDLQRYEMHVLRMKPKPWESRTFAELIQFDRKRADSQKTGVVKHVRACGQTLRNSAI
jgi:hypothetical protein